MIFNAFLTSLTTLKMRSSSSLVRYDVILIIAITLVIFGIVKS